MPLFEARNVCFVRQGHADLVETVQQAMTAEVFDCEAFRQAKVIGDDLALPDRPSNDRAMLVARARRCAGSPAPPVR